MVGDFVRVRILRESLSETARRMDSRFLWITINNTGLVRKRLVNINYLRIYQIFKIIRIRRKPSTSVQDYTQSVMPNLQTCSVWTGLGVNMIDVKSAKLSERIKSQALLMSLSSPGLASVRGWGSWRGESNDKGDRFFAALQKWSKLHAMRQHFREGQANLGVTLGLLSVAGRMEERDSSSTRCSYRY